MVQTHEIVTHEMVKLKKNYTDDLISMPIVHRELCKYMYDVYTESFARFLCKTYHFVE